MPRTEEKVQINQSHPLTIHISISKPLLVLHTTCQYAYLSCLNVDTTDVNAQEFKKGDTAKWNGLIVHIIAVIEAGWGLTKYIIEQWGVDSEEQWTVEESELQKD